MLKRFLRIIRSWFGNLLSKSENPELILNQMVEDMKGRLVQMRNQAVGVIATEKQIMQGVETSQSRLLELDNQIRLAVKAGKDDLAATLIGQKNSEEKNMAELKLQLGKAHQSSEQAKKMLRDYEAQMQKAMNEKMVLVAANKRAAMQEQLARTMSGFSVNDEFDTLESMREKIKERQARADAMLELGAARTESQVASLQETTANLEVQAQLLEYKKQLGVIPIEEPQAQPQKTMEPLKIEEKPSGG